MGVLPSLGTSGFVSDKPEVVHGGERVGKCRCKAFRVDRGGGAN